MWWRVCGGVDRVLHAFGTIQDGHHLDHDGVFSSECGSASVVEHRLAPCENGCEASGWALAGWNRVVHVGGE